MKDARVMNRATTMVAACLSALMFTASSSRAGLFGPKKLRIVTTTTDLKSIAQDIGGNKVTVTSIATGYQDPHFVEAKPSYMMKARRADLWIRVGLELEIGYEQLIIDGARNGKIRIGTEGHLDASEGVARLEVPSTQKVDRSMGDIHPLGNPHYWLDPLNGKVIARNITERLCKLRERDAAYFRSNFAKFCAKIDECLFGPALVKKVGGDRLCALSQMGTLGQFLKAEGLEKELGGWMGKMWPYRGEKVVTYHRSWSYFAHRFGLVVAEELEPKPGIPPSPRHIQEVIEKMKREGIKVILVEPFYEMKSPTLVAEKTGAKVVRVANSVGGTKEASDYFVLFDYIVAGIADAMAK